MNGIDRETFLIQNLGLVGDAVNKYAYRVMGHPSIGLEDLRQVGVIGLIKAYDRFDHSRGVRFSTYAVSMIEGEIKRYLRDNLDIVKFTRQSKVDFYKILELDLLDEKPEQIAQKLEISIKRVKDALRYYRCKTIDSLDREVYEDDGSPIFLTDRIGVEVDFDTNLELELFLNKLDEQTRKIVGLRLQEKTQQEIGQILGVSQVQISRILIKLQEQLKGGFDMSTVKVPTYQEVKKMAIETNYTAKEIHQRTGVALKIAEEYIAAFRKKKQDEVKNMTPDYIMAKKLAEETDLKPKEIQEKTGVAYATAYSYIKQFRDKKEQLKEKEKVVEVQKDTATTQDTGQTKEPDKEIITHRLDIPEKAKQKPVVESNGFMSMTIKVPLEGATSQFEGIIQVMRMLGFKEVNITLQSEQKA